MIRPSVESLHESGQYQLLESIRLDEMGQFISKQFAPASSATVPIGRKILVLGSLGIAGAVVGYLFGTALIKEANAGWQALAAVPFSLLILLPLHEAIHAIVFRLLGAQKVGFGWEPKGLMVYAYAQKFVLTLRENTRIALMPFLVLTPALLLGIALVPEYRVLLALSLVLHTFACMGDFALVRYARRNKARAIYLYDDVEGEKRSYFFEKITQ
ncbi:MAG: DUF3267 domain-containing protein [Cytophagaceae bacterium]|nr:DUF3267 domain-containing protein [Cytophagaceae bacterium]